MILHSLAYQYTEHVRQWEAIGYQSAGNEPHLLYSEKSKCLIGLFSARRVCLITEVRTPVCWGCTTVNVKQKADRSVSSHELPLCISKQYFSLFLEASIFKFSSTGLKAKLPLSSLKIAL